MRAGTQLELSKREKILDAAVAVFSDRGYRATLVDEIAQEAGVAKGTIYLYFKSKEEMYLEAFRANVEKLREQTVQRMEEARSTWDKIKAFVSVPAEFGETNKNFLRIYLTEFTGVGSIGERAPWAEELKGILRRDSDLLREVFRKAIETGEVREVPVEQLVTMLQYTVGGMMISRVTDIRLSDDNLDPEMIVDLFRQWLRPVGT